MRARSIIFVHNDPEFRDRAVNALREAGHGVTAFRDPSAALDAIEAGQVFELLITRCEFGDRQPNGLSLARMARMQRSKVKVIFVADAKYEDAVGDIGIFVPTPIEIPKVLEAVRNSFSE